MAIESIRKFMAPRKGSRSSTLRAARNRKVTMMDDFLSIHLRKLCKSKGLRPSGHLVELVAKVSGQTLSYLDAWEWLLNDFHNDPARQPWEWHDNVVAEIRSGLRRVRQEEADRREAYIAQQAILAAQQIPGAGFYRSVQWRAVRYKVLTKSAGVCEACRRSSKDHGVALHVDHILPRSQYPALALDESNLQVLCDDCNIGKGVDDTTDWRDASQDEIA